MYSEYGLIEGVGGSFGLWEKYLESGEFVKIWKF